MRITKRQLRRIIREAALAEARSPATAAIPALAKELGLDQVKTTADFGFENPDGLWLIGAAEGGGTAADGMPLADYYAGDRGPYTFGVHKDLEELLARFGLYSSWYDAGTLLAWRM